MIIAIHFNNDSPLRTVKIDNVRSYTMLASKLERLKLLPSKLRPQPNLRTRHP